MCAAAAGQLGHEGRCLPFEGVQAVAAPGSLCRFLPLQGQWWDALVTFSDLGGELVFSASC